MAKNLIPEIAKMLGVEIGEEFKISVEKQAGSKSYFYDERYKFTNNGLFKRTTVAGIKMWGRDTEMLDILCVTENAKDIIVKIPTINPDFGEVVYTFEDKITRDCIRVASLVLPKNIYGRAILKTGWVYRTREEAETALPEVAKELGVEYEV